MESDPRALDFFMGVVVGIMGNFVVSYIIEYSKGIFEGSPPHELLFWGFMFMISSTLSFYLTKFTLSQHNVKRQVLVAFDFAIITCIAIGIFMMINAYLEAYLHRVILIAIIFVAVIAVRHIIYKPYQRPK